MWMAAKSVGNTRDHACFGDVAVNENGHRTSASRAIVLLNQIRSSENIFDVTQKNLVVLRRDI